MGIAVAIVEDNPDYRLGISSIVKTSTSHEIVGEYASAEEFLEQIEKNPPDVVLMDIGLPGLSGIEATRELKRNYPTIQIVILSVYEDDEKVFGAICAGAIGYILKPVLPNQLKEAIEYAFGGGTPMSPRIARKVLEMFKHTLPVATTDYKLTEREKEVLGLLVQGYDYKLIADKLCVSLFTICAHIRNIYEKLHVHSKSQAVSKALKENIVVHK